MTGPGTAESLDATEVTRAVNGIVGDKYVRGRSALAAIGASAGPDSAPAWLVKPGSAAEIAELIRLANRHRIAVIPVGNAARAPKATRLGDRWRFFIDIRRMAHVLHMDETSLIVHAQAGLTALALEKILSPRGLSLGDYPPAALGSTIGGLLAVRTPGKSSTRHGFIEDAVLGVSGVLADGRTIHTRVAPRRSSGPDLARALCGSEGTLGLITSAVLRVHRRPETRYLAAYTLPDFASALSAVHLALREEAAPAAIRVYDGAEARAHLRDAVAADAGALVVVATAGPTDLAACDRDLMTSAVNSVGGQRIGDDPAKLWWRHRTGHGDVQLPQPTLQVSATPSKQLAVYQAVLEAAARADAFARAHASRFDADGAVIFFTATDSEGGEPIPDDRAARLLEPLRAAAREVGAFLLGASNPDLAPYFDALRTRLDPHGIMNPGALTRE